MTPRSAAQLRWHVGLLVGSLAGCASAAVTPEISRIAAERSAADAAYVARERECLRQFVVTACLDGAKQQRRATLNRLKREEIEHDEAARRAAASARQAATDAREAERRKLQEAQSGAPAAPRPEKERREPEPPSASKLLPRGPVSRRPAAEQRAIEAENVEKYEARQRAAQARKEAIERRNAARAAAGKQPTPLPVPTAPSRSPR